MCASQPFLGVNFTLEMAGILLLCYDIIAMTLVPCLSPFVPRGAPVCGSVRALLFMFQAASRSQQQQQKGACLGAKSG